MKVYTKTGDKGKTGLIGGTRVDKNDARLNAYGTIDELNSFIGLLVSLIEDAADKPFLEDIQHTLFDLGASLALDRSKCKPEDYNLSFDFAKVASLESEIDRLDNLLPPLRSFIIPGGTQQAALAHVCRTITRRAERLTYEMGTEFPVEKEILIFLNRLSDYLFVLSRYLNKERAEEKKYIKE